MNLVGLTINSFNSSHTDIDIQSASVYCTNKYNTTLQLDVYELLSEGEIAIYDNAVDTDNSLHCQHSLGMLPSTTVFLIDFCDASID